MWYVMVPSCQMETAPLRLLRLVFLEVSLLTDMKGKQQTKSSELRGRIQSKHTEMSARSALRRLAAPVRGTRNMSSGHSHEEEVSLPHPR